MEERLQKLISSCGLASRRTAEEWISSGRVTVNGEKAHLGDRADLDRDQVLVDGKRLRPGGARTYLMLNKPRGYVSTLSDGEITHRLLHPSHEVEKEYLVWVTGNVEKALPILSGPMVLDGEKLAPAQVRRGRTSGGVSQMSVVIHQGKNRQVRRMCAQAGLNVLRLKRIREGALHLDRTLAPGTWRRLTEQEVLLLTGEETTDN